MNIERIHDSKYIVFFNADETDKLKVIARAFHHSNKAATLSEVIEEGMQLSLCVKELLEDKTEQEVITKRFCETQKARVDRLWKDKDNGGKRKHE